MLLHVTDFLHYLYVAAPVSFGKDDCEGFKRYLESQMSSHHTAIHSVQMVLRENMFGFQGNQKSPYLKITVTDPKLISRLRTLIESGNANWKGMWKGVDGGVLTFDSIQYVLRFMVDTKVSATTRTASGLAPLTVTDRRVDLRHVMGGSPRPQIQDAACQ